MNRSSIHRVDRCVLASALSVALVSCAASVREPDVGAEIARATGIASAIELRVDGEPLDVAETAGGRLPLADAVIRALEHDAGLQASLASVRAALADAKQARLLQNPILSFALMRPESSGRALIVAGLSGDFAAFLKRPRATNAADRRLRSAAAEAVAAGLDVVAALRERYAAAQAIDELLPLLRERRVLLGRLVELAQSRLEFGEGTRVDVTTLHARQVELDIEIAEVELLRRVGRVAIARLIGEPSSDAEWELDGWAPLEAPASAENAWIAAALERRPEIQAAVLELAALGDDAAIAAISLWDGSALGVNVERIDDTAGPAVAVPIPVFDTGDARRSRAGAEIVAARHALVARSRRIVEEVRGAYADFVSTHRNLERVRDELVPLQRLRREDIEAIYLSGQADVTALLLAEQDLQATQAKLVELEQRAATSLVRLERAVGGSGVARDVAQPRPEAERRSDP